MLFHGPPFRQNDRRIDRQPGASRVGERLFDYIRHLMLLHLLARDRRKSTTQSGEQQSEVIIDFSRRPDRRSGIPDAYFLLNGNGRGYTFNIITFRLAHSAKKLPSIGRKTLHIATLALGIERIESQRRLSAARKPCNDHETVSRDTYIYIFQIVDPCALDKDAIIVLPCGLFHLGYGHFVACDEIYVWCKWPQR